MERKRDHKWVIIGKRGQYREYFCMKFKSDKDKGRIDYRDVEK